jgi:predicted GNAT family N-acyltransferase
MNAMATSMMADASPATGLEAAAYEVCVARTLNDLMQVVAVRSLVYIGEQSCPYGEEYDGNDFAGSTHLLLRVRGEPVGVLRIRWFADFAKFERVAVVKHHRGRRAALALIRAALRLAERKGYRRILGHAEPRLVNFWARSLNAHIRPRRGNFAFSDREYVEIITEVTPGPDALSLDSDPLVLLRPEGDWDRPGVLDRSAARGRANALERPA